MAEDSDQIAKEHSDEPSPWAWWVPPLLLTFTVAAPTTAVLLGNNAGAGVLGAVGAAALLLTRLQDITKFSLFGLKAELRSAVREANATIAQLRNLAVSLAEPSLDYMAMHGVMLSQLSFEAQYASKEKIVSALRRLKVPESKIKGVSQFWIEIALRKFSNLIAARLRTINTALADEFTNSVRLVDHKPATAAEIEKFFKKAGISDPEVTQLLDDYDLLARTGKVRRPEILGVGLQP